MEELVLAKAGQLNIFGEEEQVGKRGLGEVRVKSGAKAKPQAIQHTLGDDAEDRMAQHDAFHAKHSITDAHHNVGALLRDLARSRDASSPKPQAEARIIEHLQHIRDFHPDKVGARTWDATPSAGKSGVTSAASTGAAVNRGGQAQMHMGGVEQGGQMGMEMGPGDAAATGGDIQSDETANATPASSPSPEPLKLQQVGGAAGAGQQPRGDEPQTAFDGGAFDYRHNTGPETHADKGGMDWEYMNDGRFDVVGPAKEPGKVWVQMQHRNTPVLVDKAVADHFAKPRGQRDAEKRAGTAPAPNADGPAQPQGHELQSAYDHGYNNVTADDWYNHDRLDDNDPETSKLRSMNGIARMLQAKGFDDKLADVRERWGFAGMGHGEGIPLDEKLKRMSDHLEAIGDHPYAPDEVDYSTNHHPHPDSPEVADRAEEHVRRAWDTRHADDPNSSHKSEAAFREAHLPTYHVKDQVEAMRALRDRHDQIHSAYHRMASSRENHIDQAKRIRDMADQVEALSPGAPGVAKARAHAQKLEDHVAGERQRYADFREHADKDVADTDAKIKAAVGDPHDHHIVARDDRGEHRFAVGKTPMGKWHVKQYDAAGNETGSMGMSFDAPHEAAAHMHALAASTPGAMRVDGPVPQPGSAPESAPDPEAIERGKKYRAALDAAREQKGQIAVGGKGHVLTQDVQGHDQIADAPVTIPAGSPVIVHGADVHDPGIKGAREGEFPRVRVHVRKDHAFHNHWATVDGNHISQEPHDNGPGGSQAGQGQPETPAPAPTSRSGGKARRSGSSAQMKLELSMVATGEKQEQHSPYVDWRDVGQAGWDPPKKFANKAWRAPDGRRYKDVSFILYGGPDERRRIECYHGGRHLSSWDSAHPGQSRSGVDSWLRHVGFRLYGRGQAIGGDDDDRPIKGKDLEKGWREIKEGDNPTGTYNERRSTGKRSKPSFIAPKPMKLKMAPKWGATVNGKPTGKASSVEFTRRLTAKGDTIIDAHHGGEHVARFHSGNQYHARAGYGAFFGHVASITGAHRPATSVDRRTPRLRHHNRRKPLKSSQGLGQHGHGIDRKLKTVGDMLDNNAALHRKKREMGGGTMFNVDDGATRPMGRPIGASARKLRLKGDGLFHHSGRGSDPGLNPGPWKALSRDLRQNHRLRVNMPKERKQREPRYAEATKIVPADPTRTQGSRDVKRSPDDRMARRDLRISRNKQMDAADELGSSNDRPALSATPKKIQRRGHRAERRENPVQRPKPKFVMPKPTQPAPDKPVLVISGEGERRKEFYDGTPVGVPPEYRPQRRAKRARHSDERTPGVQKRPKRG